MSLASEIHFFNCGNGDTILIRGGNEWGLVDANFVKRLEVRERVLKMLVGVPRLRFVCITHFDLDHIRGLGDFLEGRFSRNKGKGETEWLVDQFVLPFPDTTLELLAYLKKADSRLSKGSLLRGDISGEAQKLLTVLFDAGRQIQRNRQRGATNGPQFISPEPGADLYGPYDSPVRGIGPWRCVNLGPQASTKNIFAKELADFYSGAPKNDPFEQVRANETSRVLALQHVKTKCAFLLTGDSTSDELKEALLAWRRVSTSNASRTYAFRGVKASHHGAKSCHVPEIYSQYCSPTDRTVVISAADDGRHPHRAVIADLCDMKMDYRVTGVPVARGRGMTLGGPRAKRRRGLVPGAPRDSPAGDVQIRLVGSRFEISGGRQSQFHT